MVLELNEKKSEANEVYHEDQMRYLWNLYHEPDIQEPIYVKESN
jgi:hypothetical protein